MQPSSPFGELKGRFRRASDLEVLKHCMGIERIQFDRDPNPAVDAARNVANQLAAHTILICIDTEHWTLNSDEMTELGIAVVKTDDVSPISQAREFGDHGENLMKQSKFYFYRFREKAHLPTTNAASRGPEGNRFGEARFVTFAQGRACLNRLFMQRITKVPALRHFNHPIVVMGHAIGHDKDHLNGKDLGFNIDATGTVIRYIDTQLVTQEKGYWLDQQNKIGLDKLVTALGFEHTDAHTAANDIGRTLICGVLLAIPPQARKRCSRTLEQVTRDFEHWSRNTFVGQDGTAKYCSKCGNDQHNSVECTTTGMSCNHCISRGLYYDAATHINMHCPWVRDEVSAERGAWFDGQPPRSAAFAPGPKVRFHSRLQPLSGGAAPIPLETQEEITERKAWYYNQKASEVEIKPFVFWRRSFRQWLGTPNGQQWAMGRINGGLPLEAPKPPETSGPPVPLPRLVVRPLSFPPAPAAGPPTNVFMPFAGPLPNASTGPQHPLPPRPPIGSYPDGSVGFAPPYGGDYGPPPPGANWGAFGPGVPQQPAAGRGAFGTSARGGGQPPPTASNGRGSHNGMSFNGGRAGRGSRGSSRGQ